MATIDKLQKISDTVWELPATYKQGMRVPARMIATPKLLHEMDEGLPSNWRATRTRPGESSRVEDRSEARFSVRTGLARGKWRRATTPGACFAVA